MRNILATAKLTFVLNIRKGSLWGILVFIIGTSTFIFLGSTGDNILVNELQLRIHYSYAIAYSLLTLIIISVSCFTVRSEIDGRQMHMLTSFPLSRKEIWLGKWLGLVFIAITAEIVLCFTLLTCSYFYIQSYSPEEIQSAKIFFGKIKYEKHPLEISLRKRTQERINRLIQDKKLNPAEITDDLRKSIFDQIRKEDQLVSPNTEKTWHFDLGGKPDYGDYLELKFKFYAESRRKRIQGTWLITAPGKVESFSSEFEVVPYTFNAIEIPLAQIPDTGKFDVTLKAQNETDLIVGKKTGLRIYYEDGPLINNIIKAISLQLIHLSVTAGVGLTAGVAFTFSVASFLSIVLYFLSVSSAFFTGIVRDLAYGYHISFLDQIATLVIKSGLWLAKGLQPPSIIPLISSGISIPIGELFVSWFPVIFIYGTVIVLIGIFLLNQKELDKVVTQL